jgi:hypothetical protein
MFVGLICPSTLNNSALTGRFSWNLIFFKNLVTKFQVSLKYDKNNGHFTLKPIFIFDHILLSSSKNEKLLTFQTKVVEKIKTHILCSITFFENHAFYEIMWKNSV